ncbi:hypothetical protein [Pseudonocardia ailaonensis]
MATLLIQHAVTDLDTWRRAFAGFADARARAGVRAQRVSRPVDDPCAVVVELDFDSVAAATAFREFLRTRVWADPASSPALAGAPRADVLVPVDSLRKFDANHRTCRVSGTRAAWYPPR